MIRVSDTDVIVKILSHKSITYEGQSIEAWIISINGKYVATFTYEDDLTWYLDRLASKTKMNIIIEYC